MIRDILNLEHEPLNRVLTVESLKPDLKADNETDFKTEDKTTVNTNITPMGRPINIHPLIRWKPIDVKLLKSKLKEDDEYNNKKVELR